MSMAGRAVAAIALGCTAVTCGVAGAARTDVERSQATARRVVPLTVIEAATPSFPVPRYDTSGAIPQVRGENIDLRAVNAALREAVLADQRAYAPSARRAAKMAGKDGRGVYETSVNRRLLSASTRVVSALIPALELYPDGNDGNTWLSVTARVPSGYSVTLRSLFAARSHGLRALATAVKRRMLATIRCVREAVHDPDPVIARSFARGFEPTANNYRYFALTSRGVAVGFPLGQVSFPPCNRVEATVPYALVGPYLSTLGKDLIAGVRAPR
jgi:hypothetical protein